MQFLFHSLNNSFQPQCVCPVPVNKHFYTTTRETMYCDQNPLTYKSQKEQFANVYLYYLFLSTCQETSDSLGTYKATGRWK